MPVRYDDYIKKPNKEIEWDQEKVQELIKCKSDVIYFTTNYVKVANQELGITTMQPRDYQIDLLNKFVKHNRNIVLMSRQSGKSASVSAYILWYSCFNPEKNIGIVSNKEKSAKQFLSRLKDCYLRLPEFLKPGVLEWAQTSVRFDNGTYIQISATSEDSFRGEPLSILCCDELAAVMPNKAQAFWASVYPTVSASKTAKVIIVSTAKGQFNTFHNIWVGAVNKTNSFIATRYDWRVVPGRTESWAEEERKNIGSIQFNQEFNCIGGESIIVISYNGKMYKTTISHVYNILASECNYGLVKNNKNIKIWTPNGFQSFDGIQKVIKNEYLKIDFNDNTNIICSLDHPFGKDKIKALNLKIGDRLQNKSIIDIQYVKNNKELFDPINVNNGNIYYANDLLNHNCEFLGSTNTVIDSDVLEEITGRPIVDPEILQLGGHFRIYERPNKKHLYILGVDSAKGTGLDYSVIQVLKVESLDPVKLKQVAVYECNTINPYSFSEVVNRTSIYYNNAYIMVENNGEGSVIVSQLWWEYENDKLVNEGSKVSKLGVRATTKTKPKAVLLMKRFIEDGSLEIVDKNTLDQLTDFQDLGNNRFACKNMHDDLISALYWGCYFFEMNILGEDYNMKSINTFDDAEDEFDGWGLLTDNDPETEEDWEWLSRI